MNGLRILHIEDDPVTAAIVREQLEGNGHGSEWAETGARGLEVARGAGFDVIVLDRNLPDMTGLDVVRRLRAEGVAVPVLMLSALGRSENRVEGLDAGVDDYLAKPYEASELLARVHALHRRTAQQEHGAIITYGDLECHVKARTVHRQGKHIPLSPKEYTLFKYLIDHAGDVVTRDMLLKDVWKLNFDPQTNVIDVSIGRLRRKLEDGFESSVLETIWGSGYRLVAR